MGVVAAAVVFALGGVTVLDVAAACVAGCGEARYGPSVGADHAGFERLEEGFEVRDTCCDEGGGADNDAEEAYAPQVVGGVFGKGGLRAEIVDLDDGDGDDAVEMALAMVEREPRSSQAGEVGR